MSAIILDTGPLLAALTPAEEHHLWAREQMLQHPVLLTCEAVITEACHLIKRSRGNPLWIMQAVERGGIKIGMNLAEEMSAVRALFERYDNVPASLADACLIRMSELYEPSAVMTLDSDFHVYRRYGRRVIPLIRP